MEVIGWILCTAGYGPHLSPHHAVGPQKSAGMDLGRQGPRAGAHHHADMPPRQALFVSVDVTKSAGGEPCLECYDLRSGLPMSYSLDE
jgi:hypothetical protein